MRAEVAVRVDKDNLAFTQMRNESGLWVITVNAGHIVKMVRLRGPVKLQVDGCAVPTKEEILDGDGVWLIYTRARFVRSAVRVPRGQSVEDLVREMETGGGDQAALS